MVQKPPSRAKAPSLAPKKRVTRSSIGSSTKRESTPERHRRGLSLLLLVPILLGGVAIAGSYLFPQTSQFPQMPKEPGTIGYILSTFFDPADGSAKNTEKLGGEVADNYLKNKDCTAVNPLYVWKGVNPDGTPKCGPKGGAMLAMAKFSEIHAGITVERGGSIINPDTTTPLLEGDKIITNGTGTGTIKFDADESIIRLDTSTTVTLKQGTLAGQSVAEAILSDGRLWARILSDNGVLIGGGGIVAGVRGTSLSVEKNQLTQYVSLNIVDSRKENTGEPVADITIDNLKIDTTNYNKGKMRFKVKRNGNALESIDIHRPGSSIRYDFEAPGPATSFEFIPQANAFAAANCVSGGGGYTAQVTGTSGGCTSTATFASPEGNGDSTGDVYPLSASLLNKNTTSTVTLPNTTTDPSQENWIIQSDTWVQKNTQKDIAYLNTILATNPGNTKVSQELAATEPQLGDPTKESALCGTGESYWKGMTDPDRVCQESALLAFADYSKDKKLYFKNGSIVTLSSTNNSYDISGLSITSVAIDFVGGNMPTAYGTYMAGKESITDSSNKFQVTQTPATQINTNKQSILGSKFIITYPSTPLPSNTIIKLY